MFLKDLFLCFFKASAVASLGMMHDFCLKVIARNKSMQQPPIILIQISQVKQHQYPPQNNQIILEIQTNLILIIIQVGIIIILIISIFLFQVFQCLSSFNNIQQLLITKIPDKQKMETVVDYRNAKYQGETNNQQHRNGFGILIDDDLSFYVSNWNDGKLNDDTMIYISHGKYIYGQWIDNQPHGLNVFRIGDTVVLGEFDNGYLVKKVIIIFEKFNFLAILEQVQGQWTVCERGVLKSYSELIKYIQQAGIPMQPQYFSLAKFITSMSNQYVTAVPCQGSENCFFGYQEGLGIIFNSNNGVVSVGCHSNKKLTDFGGKYELPHFVLQGNFSTNQVVKYTTERPKMQIYSIFQKIHKRSLNFKNQYFDSKVKLLTHIQQLIRTKIQQIVDENNNPQQNTFTALDLNDSLDYHVENLQEMSKLNKIRQDVYQAVHIPLKKATSQYVQASPKLDSKKSSQVQFTPKKNSGQNTNTASPVLMKKSPIKNKDKTKQRQMLRTPSKKSIQSSSHSNRIQSRDLHNQDTFAKIQNRSPLMTKQQSSTSEIQIPRSVKSSAIKKIQQKSSFQKSCYKKSKYTRQEIYDMEPPSPIDQMLSSSKNYIRQKEFYDVPSFKYSHSEYQKDSASKNVSKTNLKMDSYEKSGNYGYKQYKVQRSNRFQKVQTADWAQKVNEQSGENGSRVSVSPLNITQNRPSEISRSPIKNPNYENLSQRRKRLLKQFKNLNQRNQNPLPTSNISKITSQMPSRITPTKYSVAPSVIPKNNSYHQSSIESHQQLDKFESPYRKQKIPSYESKNTEQSQTMMPLTICKGNNQLKNLSYYPQNENQNDKKSIISDYKNILKQKMNINRNEPQINLKSNYKENIQTIYSAKTFEKKQSYQEKQATKQLNLQLNKVQMQENTKISPEMLTPNRKKAYKYYFDD